MLPGRRAERPREGGTDGIRSGVRHDRRPGDSRWLVRVQGNHLLLLLPGMPGGLSGRSRELPDMSTGTTTITKTDDQPGPSATAVLEMAGLQWASEKAVIERVLAKRPGVSSVLANPVGQTATVQFDPRVTSVAELRGWVQECRWHCAGQSVPAHICDPM